MIEKPINAPIDDIAPNDTHNTEKIDSELLSIETHEQYLQQLNQQFNMDINRAVLFYVQGYQEPMIFTDKEKIIVGRSDSRGRINPEFDLSRFNGVEYGVSRLHAKIIWDDGKYYIEDLHSTNRTHLNGQRLVPYQYTPLTDGSILQFGRLLVNVFIITDR